MFSKTTSGKIHFYQSSFVLILLLSMFVSCKKSDENPLSSIDEGIYIAGYETNSDKSIAKYWKKNEEVNLTDGSTYAAAVSMVVVGKDIYVAGFERANDLNSKYVAKYWKNGVAVNLSETNNFADAYEIKVANNDVYVAGYEYRPSNVQVAKYWKNGIGVTLSNSKEASYARSIFISK